MTEPVSDSQLGAQISNAVTYPFSLTVCPRDPNIFLVGGFGWLTQVNWRQKTTSRCSKVPGRHFNLVLYEDWILCFTREGPIKVVDKLGTSRLLFYHRASTMNCPDLEFNPGKLVLLVGASLYFIAEEKKLIAVDLNKLLPALFSDQKADHFYKDLASDVNDLAYDRCFKKVATISHQGILTLDVANTNQIRTQIETELWFIHSLSVLQKVILVGCCAKNMASLGLSHQSSLMLVGKRGEVLSSVVNYSPGIVKHTRLEKIGRLMLAIVCHMHDYLSVFAVLRGRLHAIRAAVQLYKSDERQNVQDPIYGLEVLRNRNSLEIVLNCYPCRIISFALKF